MSKIIYERTQTGEPTTGIEYQKNDYVIAARTGYFNQAKNAGKLDLYTEGGNAIPREAVQAIPDLDPTLVKAVAMQESNIGITGIDDIMTANNPGDFQVAAKLKSAYGLTKDTKLSETNSLYFGIRLIASKGFRGGIDGKGGFVFQGWDKATNNYNGGGTKGYQGYVNTMKEETTTPECTNYTNECK